MSSPYFIFKNKHSRDYNIVVNKLPPIPTFSNEVDLVEVPGRDGFLTIDLGRRKSIDLSVDITIFPDDYLQEIMEWFRGSGRVLFSNQDDVFYNCRVESIRLFVGNRADKTATIVFHCQPHAYLFSGDDTLRVDSKNTTLINQYTKSKPTIKIFGSGAGDVTINNKKIIIDNINSSIVIDSELEESYSGTQQAFFKGEYPVLTYGDNVITWSGGVTRLEVIPRWRR